MTGQANATGEGRRQPALAARAFTVLELLIVMSILVLLMAVTWPALRRPLDRSQTLEAARQLARDVSQTRILAIQRGETLVVRFQPGGPQYQIEAAERMLTQSADDTALDDHATLSADLAPETEDGLPDLTVSSDLGDATAPNWDQPLPELEPQMLELPDGVSFTDPTISDQSDEFSALGEQPPPEESPPEADPGLGPQSDDPLEMLEKMDDAADAGNWSRPILFFPTGRSESVTFRLAGADGYWITVTLRGMTGAVSIGPLQHTLRVNPTEPTDRTEPPQESRVESGDAESRGL